ncbi:MAG: S41 family peptidase [Crocinitomicaceae bacterium]|nr:S41 family peptidase [Crocinitomicaceae bacterium]
MTRIVLTASIVLLSLQAISQENKLNALLDSVISTSQEVSYYSSSVNWDSLSTEMHGLAAEPKELVDLKPAFTLMLNKLRDHHGRIMSTSDYSNLATFNDWENSRHRDERDSPSEQWSVVNNLDVRFEYALLPGNVAYLKIVGIGGNVDGQKEAERIRAAVCGMASTDIEEWIIDLRYNSGGNVNVMLEGIAPLFDTKSIASSRDANDDVQFTAEIKKGNFWYAGMSQFNVKKGPKIKDPNIAVLLSRWTASSGELTAIAFKGQENVKFFGEETGGYTTNNCFTVFDNQIALVISTGVFCDRNGNSYDENVKPDIEIAFDFEADRSKDEGIIQASEWLLKNED